MNRKTLRLFLLLFSSSHEPSTFRSQPVAAAWSFKTELKLKKKQRAEVIFLIMEKLETSVCIWKARNRKDGIRRQTTTPPRVYCDVNSIVLCLYLLWLSVACLFSVIMRTLAILLHVVLLLNRRHECSFIYAWKTISDSSLLPGGEAWIYRMEGIAGDVQIGSLHKL